MSLWLDFRICPPLHSVNKVAMTGLNPAFGSRFGLGHALGLVKVRVQ